MGMTRADIIADCLNDWICDNAISDADAVKQMQLVNELAELADNNETRKHDE